MDEGNGLLSRIFDLHGGKKDSSKPTPPTKSGTPKKDHEHHHHHEEHHGAEPGQHQAAQSTVADGSKDHDQSQSHGSHDAHGTPDASVDDLSSFMVGGGPSKKQVTSNASIHPKKIQKGGGSLNVPEMFKKFGWFYLLLLITMFVTFYIMFYPAVYQKYFNEDNDDDFNFESETATHASRYNKLSKVILAFHVIFLIVLLVILLMILVLLFVYTQINKSLGLNARQLFSNIFFTFDNDDGNRIELTDFYLAFVVILCFGYLVYRFYFKFVKSFFINLKYPKYIDEDSPLADSEYQNPQKFIIFYGLMILYIFVFAFMVMNYVYGFNTKIAFIWNTVFLFFIMFFTGTFLKFMLLRDKKKQMITFGIIFATVILNKPVGTALQKIADNMVNLFKKSQT